jgi:3-oxoacyl-ACP reductase-like protein
MRSNVAPGPDGLNAAFYKASWNWVKQDLLQLVSDFYSEATLPTEINQTFLTLIPKKTKPFFPPRL